MEEDINVSNSSRISQVGSQTIIHRERNGARLVRRTLKKLCHSYSKLGYLPTWADTQVFPIVCLSLESNYVWEATQLQSELIEANCFQ